jgi:hypothetical protein
MSALACIGEPVSWLRLEQTAMGAHDAAVDGHLAECEACRACLADIRGDVVALPALPELAARPPRRWLRWGIPAFGAALAAAAIAIVVVRPDGDTPVPPAPRDDVANIKGVGEVIVGTVRERAGAVTDDAPTFRAGDRWKVVVTCPLAASAWLDVAVYETCAPPSGGAARPGEAGPCDAGAIDYPLPAVRVACGNRVVVPGAFELTGTHANRICAIASAGAPPPRGAVPTDHTAACVTIRPE